MAGRWRKLRARLRPIGAYAPVGIVQVRLNVVRGSIAPGQRF